MTQQLPDDRAEQAARDWFAEQAAGTSAPSVDPHAVRAAATRRQRLRFTAMLAAAAVVVAALVIVPLALRPDSPVTGIPAPSETTPAVPAGWARVTPPDPQPRQDPLLTYADGKYYLMGGYRHDPSGDDVQLTTGFRLDPATSAWQPIADLPQVALSTPYSMAADVVGLTIYVHFSFEELGELWAYDTVADAWRKITDTDETERFVSTVNGLFRVPVPDDDTAPVTLQRLEEDRWVDVTLAGTGPVRNWGPIVPLDDHRLAWVADQVSILDTSTMTWAEPVTPPASAVSPGLEPEAVGGGGALVLVYKTNRDSATPASLEVFTFAQGGWEQRPATTERGGLNWFSAGPSAGGWVVVHGNLLDPVSGQWHTVPAIPGSDGSWEPVWVAGGEPGLLTCFPKDAVDDAEYVADCYLYRLTGGPAPATPGTPSATGAPAEPAWRTVAPPDPEPRRDPLVVHAAGSYYLMGGWRSDADWNTIQLRTGFRLDPATGNWSPIAELPQVGLSNPYTIYADVVGPTIYVHFVFEEMGELWAYDTAADGWRKLENTGEGDYFVGTEDGLVKVLSDEGGSQLLLLTGGQWLELPRSPAGQGAFRLGDHQLGYLDSSGGIAVLDTATRSWLPTSPPGDIINRSAYGVDGAAVLVYPPDSEGELMPNYKIGLKVAVLADGHWTEVEPMLTDGGLGSQIGAVTGSRIVIAGNLFDPHTLQWQSVPAIPGSDYQWVSQTVAGGPQGVLSCFPIRDIDAPEPQPVDSCYFLSLA